MKRALPFIALLFCLRCASTAAPRGEVVIGYFSGGPAPYGTIVTIREDGEMILQTPRPIHGWVDAVEAKALIATLRSPEMKETLGRLAAKGYRSGCCDQADIFIKVDGAKTEAAVWDVATGKPALPAEVIEVLRRVDRLAGRTFGMRHSYPLEPR